MKRGPTAGTPRTEKRFQRPNTSELAQEVLAEARHMPADAALRNVLKRWRGSPEQKRRITKLVFAYFRWLRWLDDGQDLKAQLAQALELQNAFSAHPARISDEELMRKAVPDWAHTAAALTPATLREFQSEPRLWLRARLAQGAELGEELGECEPHPFLPDALCYRGEEDLFLSPAFREGRFEIQDPSSQAVSLICAPKPGETWWDACAGEGGKTLHLADLMQNRGLVWATDRAAWRLEKLHKRAARARLFNYRTKHWPNFSHLPLKARVDGLLVDAPCSGMGTWGRNPHARWSTTLKDVEELAALQRQLLDKLSTAVKSGGRLIYSVCTLATAETLAVANNFDEQHPEFTPMQIANPLQSEAPPEPRIWILPRHSQGNGMFIAAWRKT